MAKIKKSGRLVIDSTAGKPINWHPKEECTSEQNDSDALDTDSDVQHEDEIFQCDTEIEALKEG